MTSLKFLEKGLDAAVVRRSTIANNIANVDVPGFKRSSVSFEATLKRAIEKEASDAEREQFARTNDPRHIHFFQKPDLDQVKPVVHTDYLSSMRNDGNNVDMEEEITDLARNQMQYSLLIERIGGAFRTWNGLLRMA